MKKSLLTFILCCMVFGASFAQTIAFPGAEGFGRFAKGARATETPSIFHVTNLNDSGTGSFRDAISQPNRVVVFDVGGIIKITERLVFSKNLTIAGQTAPGDGISVYGNGVSFSSADNIIVRYIRFRMGIKGDSGKDAAGIANGSNMIFDHLSIGWGLDENFSISWDNKGTVPTNITIQKSIIGQGVMVHACGGLIQTIGGVTIFKNLYVDNKTRNPKVKGLNQFVNNVVYNWGSGGGYILGGDSEGPSWGVIDNNYFVKGPDTNGTDAFVRGNANFQVCHKGNILDYNLDGVLNGEVAPDSVYGPVTIATTVDSFTDAPQRHPDLNGVVSAAQAYAWVVDSVGACIPSRDEVDKYMINDLTSLGTKGALINGESDLGLANGVGNVFSAVKAQDTDNDGIPDAWEDANGLNKDESSDALIVNADGYLNIERYINAITTGAPFVKYPTLLGVKGIDTNLISLKWKNNATSSTAIILEQSTNNINFTELARLDATAVEYKADNLAPNTSYFYRLKTVNIDVESMYSASLKATTMGVASPPIACTEPTPADKSIVSAYSQETLKWTNLTGNWAGVLSYDVYAGKTETELLQVADSISGTTVLLSMEPSTTYFWRVDATNLMGKQQGDVWSFTSGKKPEREKVAYWPLNETEGTSATNDVSGYASAKDFTPTWGAGKVQNGITFPGTGLQGMVQSNYDAINIGSQSFSVELWFKSNGGTVDYYLFHKGSHSLNSTTGATGKWFGLQYQKNSSNDRFTWGVDDNSTKTVVDVKPGSAYFNNAWTHVVCIRNKEAVTLQVYINGILKGEVADKTGDISEIENFVLGNANVTFLSPFAGQMDELSIYNSVLTAPEVMEKYQEGMQTGLHGATANTDMVVYPNPFTDRLTINLPSLEDGLVEVRLFSVSGQLIYENKANISNRRIQILGLDKLTSGMYICVVKPKSDAAISVRLIK